MKCSFFILCKGDFSHMRRRSIRAHLIFNSLAVILLPLILFREGCAYRTRAIAWQRKQGHAIADAMEFGTLEGILGCIAVGLGWTLMPRRVVEQSAHAADLVIESVPPDIALVPTGMIALREGPALPALRTLSEGIVASAQRPRAA